MKKLQVLILVICSVLLFSSSTILSNKAYATEAASTWPGGPAIESLSGVVMDFDTGTICYEKDTTTARYPASITKIMTALVALENSSLDEVVTFSQYAVYSIEKGSSSISRDIGEEMTMEQCIYGLMLESANECGNAIAEHVGGDVEGFVNMMNEKAAELGCVNTHFTNPHGLHDENHYTCAYDMALIARAAYENPTFALITGSKRYTIPPTNKHDTETPLNNHHAMLNYYRTNQYLYEYCVGGKTGYTSDALGTLVTYAKKDDMTLIAVTMCGSGSTHYTDTRTLFDYYFANMQNIKIGDLGGDMSNMLGDSISMLENDNEIPFEVDLKATVFLPIGADLTNLKWEFTQDNSGDYELGAIQYSYGNKNVGLAKIISKDVEKYPFMNSAGEQESEEQPQYLVVNAAKIVLISIGVLILLAFAIYTFFKTNNAVAVARRKRIENRDPHKNYRRINRRRRNRRNR